MKTNNIKSCHLADDELNKLNRDFYQRDTLTVARDLLGRYLIHQSATGRTIGRIVETEAYLGEIDKAAHSYRGKTKRVEVMFGSKGYAYVYLIYGMYSCFNIVTGPFGKPESVLIRALEPISGLDLMIERRKSSKLVNLSNGPGKLSQAMDIDYKRHNSLDLCGDQLFLTIGKPADSNSIVATPRININYAEEAITYPWRFVINYS